jgi:hypothetical protein
MRTPHLTAIISERGDHPTVDPYHPSAAWEPAVGAYDVPVGTLFALAVCGIHYGWYDPAAVKAGDLPCPTGKCPSPGWTV